MKRIKYKGYNKAPASYRRHPTSRSRELSSLSLDARGYPTGKDGTVWATFDRWQAEIIRNALLTQHMGCELTDVRLEGKMLHLLRIADEKALDEAMDFVWRDHNGLRLKPDWSYPAGVANSSFEKWLGEV